jgi:hypothetical protein
MVALVDSLTTKDPAVPQRGYVQIGWKIVALVSVLVAASVPAFCLCVYLIFLAEAVLTTGVDFYFEADHSSTDLSIALCLTLASAMSLYLVNEHGLSVMFILVAMAQGVSHLLTRRYLPMMSVTEAGGTYISLLAAPWRRDPNARVVSWEEFMS